MRGKYIILEGGEGGGKTTQQDLLANYLRASGIDVVTTKEPGGTYGADALRAVVLDKASQLDPTAQLLTMYAARVDHLAKIVAPAIEAGTWVISDRGWPSSYAYQGPHVDRRLLEVLQEAVVPDDLWGDVIFYLKVSPQQGVSRAKSRNASDGNQQTFFDDKELDFHNGVTVEYDILAADPGWFTIDASKSIEEVHQDLISHINLRDT